MTNTCNMVKIIIKIKLNIEEWLKQHDAPQINIENTI